MKLSVLIPAHNEESTIVETLIGVFDILTKEKIEHEILVVNDYSENLEAIAKLLATLDTPPAQVVVEATILQTRRSRIKTEIGACNSRCAIRFCRAKRKI